MLLLEFIDIEMEKSEEEIVHSLRGSKSSGFKSAKNIMKNIRCRLATRHLATTFHREGEFVTRGINEGMVADDREDKLLEFPLAAPPQSQSQELVASSRQAFETLFDFTSEAEVVSAVSEASQDRQPSSNTDGDGSRMEVDAGISAEDEEVSEEYRRCCKVWLKIMAMSQAKGLLWEVDENMYPGYFESMQKPLMLVNVAYKLLQRSYPASSSGGGDGSIRDNKKIGSVSSCFYRDMRQVLVNCISYNSEATALYGHAQKLLQVLHRHMQQWVLSSSRPEKAAQCDESCCLHSHSLIASGRGEYTSVKCGRCAGVFSLSSLQELEQQQEFGVFQPTEEQVMQSHEDWICHLCLREDGVAAVSNVSSRDVESFSIDEWGPSACLPWHLNTRHILQMHQFTDDMPNLPSIVEAVKIIAAPNLTPMLPRDDDLSSDGDFKPGQKALLPWTMRERLKVYAALCELLKSHEVSHNFMTDLYKECTKLTKMSVTDSFCEADFIEQVKKVAGTEGVALCRSLLDGVETDSEAVKQNKVVEGRCIHCRGSTFEDNVAEDDEVLLCDGCNAEAHLSCLTIDKVPTREWYCDPCADRIASRVEGDETSLDIDSHRRTDLEAALQEESALLQRDGLPNPRPLETCAYCGGSELDLCSPLVYGQSREEFDEHMKNFIGTLDLDQSTSESQIQAAPAIPFFPLVMDPKSSKMVLSSKKHSALVSCPVVHEICALKMCQARMQRSRHSIRRKRKVIADRVADMSYISSRPIGHDDRGRFYWQFPNSNSSLFISPPSLMEVREPEKAALAEKMEAQKSGKKDKVRRTPQKKGKGRADNADNVDPATLFTQSPVHEDKIISRSTGGKWLRVTSLLEIAKVIELLGTSRSEAEISLCQALRTLYHNDISKHHQQTQEKDKNKVKEEVGSDEMEVVEVKDVDDQSLVDDIKPTVEGDVGNAEVKSSDEGDNVPNKAQFSEFSYKENDRGDNNDDEDLDDEEWDYGRRRPPRRAAAPIIPRAKPGEGIPVNMVLLPELGPEVLPEYVIKKEKVFEDSAGENMDDGASDDSENDLSYQKYFMFSRSSKFFAIALQDCYNTTCKLGKRFTINFQIHHEDDDEPLACTLLREPWDDGVYYFATLSFKKSGKYTISFLAEGAKATNIAPLVFPVRVVAEHVSLGAECALDNLRAYSFITHGERQISHRRRELVTELNRTSNEFAAVKSLILAVYLALPLGALSMGFAEEDRLSKYDMAGAVVNATGWNSVMDQLWRESVLIATSSAALMECILLLEFYINKNWLIYPHSKLLATLPSPHYAMRCATNSAVALRVYCLDKALAYDRVQDLIRPTKAGEKEKKEQIARGVRAVRKEEKPRRSKSSQAAKRGLERIEATALMDVAQSYGDSIGSSRPRRAAMTRARENMSQSLRQEYDDEEEFGGGRSRRARRGQTEDQSYEGPKEWSCSSCTYVNPPRARSCEACSEKKPAEGGNPSLLKASLAMSREERMRKRNGVYEEEEEFDEEESSSEEGDDDDDDDDETRRDSTRKRKRVLYREVGSDEDEVEEGKKPKRSVRATESTEADESLIDLETLLEGRREQLMDNFEGLSEEERRTAQEGDLVVQMLEILRKLQQNPISDPFWEPVDEDYYTDYSDKVDEPMDLGSIARRVSVGFYAHADEFAEDVRKVWSNCQAYNDESSEIHNNSKDLGTHFEDLLSQLRNPVSKDSSPDMDRESEGRDKDVSTATATSKAVLTTSDNVVESPTAEKGAAETSVE